MKLLLRIGFGLLLLGWLGLTVALYTEDLPLIRVDVASVAALAWLMGSAMVLVAVIAWSLPRPAASANGLPYEAFSTYLSEPILLCNAKGKIQWQNDAARALFPLDKPLPEPAQALLNRTHATGGVGLQVLPVDSQRRFSAQAIPVKRGLYALILKPIQTDNNPMYDNFIRRIVHDMRNPLAGIIGHAANLQYVADAERNTWQNSAKTIEKEAQRLARLVDSMLFDARLAYMPLAVECLDVMDVVEEAFFMHEERAFKMGKHIEVNATSSRLMVQGDRDLLLRAFENLIDNSLKYTSEKGRLDIHVTEQNGHCELCFQDNGAGIPPEYLPDRIFEPLVRGRSSGSGSGLGLSIVKKIVEMHHGRIRVESELQKGTRMMITLPKAGDPCSAG